MENIEKIIENFDLEKEKRIPEVDLLLKFKTINFKELEITIDKYATPANREAYASLYHELLFVHHGLTY